MAVRDRHNAEEERRIDMTKVGDCEALEELISHQDANVCMCVFEKRERETFDQNVLHFLIVNCTHLDMQKDEQNLKSHMVIAARI